VSERLGRQPAQCRLSPGLYVGHRAHHLVCGSM
jgi:hypothetical protein